MSDPEIQHINPKSIVKRFKIKGSPLSVIEEDGSLEHWSEEKAIAVKHHYTLIGEESDKFKVEKGFWPYENKFGSFLSELHKKISKGDTLDIEKSKDDIHEFFMLQIVRSVEFNMGPSEEEMKAGFENEMAKIKEKLGGSLLGKKFSDEDRERIMHNSRKLSILEGLGISEKIIKRLNISLCTTSENTEFITGSCPLSLDVPVSINSNEKRRIVFPVGRHVALIMSDDPEGEIHSLSDTDVNAVNDGIARKSKIIVGSSDKVVEQYEEVRAADL